MHLIPLTTWFLIFVVTNTKEENWLVYWLRQDNFCFHQTKTWGSDSSGLRLIMFLSELLEFFQIQP